MKKELLEYSYLKGLTHIPSALSMLDYVWVLFKNGHVKYEDKIVIGKPFGSQAYYLVWDLLDKNLSMGVKHEEIDFVDYGEETMGNALGVGIGMALATDKKVWVNITDGALQMGPTLEALQFIGHHKPKNLLVTIDYNGSQVTGTTKDILDVDPVLSMIRTSGVTYFEVDGHNRNDLQKTFQKTRGSCAVVVCKTQKGHGVRSFTEDLKKWHYKKIESEQELQSLVQELQGT
jgi:transketolase